MTDEDETPTPKSVNELNNDTPLIDNADVNEMLKTMSPADVKLFMKRLNMAMSKHRGRSRAGSKKPIPSPAQRKAKRKSARASRRRNRM